MVELKRVQASSASDIGSIPAVDMVFRVNSENPALRVHARRALLIGSVYRRLGVRGKLFIIQTCASFQQTVHVNGRGLLFCDFLIDLRQLVPVQEDGPGAAPAVPAEYPE